MHKFLSSLRDVNALPVPLHPMSLSLSVRDLRCSIQVDRVVLQRELHLVMATLTRRQPSEVACGVMMSLDPSERVGILIRFDFAT